MYLILNFLYFAKMRLFFTCIQFMYNIQIYSFKLHRTHVIMFIRHSQYEYYKCCRSSLFDGGNGSYLWFSEQYQKLQVKFKEKKLSEMLFDKTCF